MKKRIFAVILSLALIVFVFSGCSSSYTSGEVVYGQITELSESSITIELGTLNETNDDTDSQDSTDETESSDNGEITTQSNTTAQAESESDDENTVESNESSKQSQPDEEMSIIDLTGDTLTVSITDDTTFSRQNMGNGQPGGDAPDMSSDNSNDEEPPEKPSGDGDDASSDSEEPPEIPSGDNEDNSTDDTQLEQSEDITISDLSVGDIVSVTFDDDGNASQITIMSSSMAGGGEQQTSSGVDSYDAVVEYTEDTEVDGDSISSTGTDENAIHAYNDAIVNLKNIAVSRISSDSTGGDNSSFYGVGAGILATESTLYVSDSTIETDAAGGAGIFSYGNSVVYTADTTITTQQDTSGGIHAAGGGTLYAWDMTVETNGESSAAIRSDRGGGTMVVDGGTYTSNGTGSPAVYSTADIIVNNSTLTATASEAVCIEGLNSLRLFDCDLTGNMKDDSQNDCTWNVILYQSMSGDSEVGNSTFEMSGGSITANNGGMFYTTNTESTFVLNDVDITYSSDSEFFLRCSGNNNQRGWGSSGSNGADCNFTAISQEMIGDVIWDSISTLDFYITEQSSLTGAVVDDETYASDGSDGYCNLYIDDDSVWVVTGDSTLTNLYSNGSIVDEDGNTVTIVGTDSTVYVNGSSDYTITVESYSTSVDLSGASTISSFSDYEVERPSQLD